MGGYTAKFKYIFDRDYNPKRANGAFGGLTPQGEVVMNFYMERAAVPYEQEFVLNEDGTLGDCIRTEPAEFKFIRYMQGGVIMTREEAKNLAVWLESLLQEES